MTVPIAAMNLIAAMKSRRVMVIPFPSLADARAS
jgi:hypothetical protein